MTEKMENQGNPLDLKKDLLSPEAKNALVKSINGNLPACSIGQTIKEFDLPSSIFDIPELKDLAEKSVRNQLMIFFGDHHLDALNASKKMRRLDDAVELQKKFGLSASDLNCDEEFQSKAKAAMIDMLQADGLGAMEEIRNAVGFSKAIYFSDEFQKKAQKKADSQLFNHLEYLNTDDLDYLLKLRKIFNISLDPAKNDQRLLEKMVERLAQGHENKVEEIRSLIFGDDKKIYGNPEFRKAGHRAMVDLLNGEITQESLNHLDKLANTVFGGGAIFLDAEINEAAKGAVKKQFLNYLENICHGFGHNMEKPLSLAELLTIKFGIHPGEIESNVDVQIKAKEAIIGAIGYLNFEMIDKIKDRFSVPDAASCEKPVMEKATEVARKLLEQNLEYIGLDSRYEENIEHLKKLSELFDINEESLKLNPEIQEKAKAEMLEKIKAGNYLEMKQVKEIYSVSDEIYGLIDFRKAAADFLLQKVALFSDYDDKYNQKNIDAFNEVKRLFSIPDKIFQTEFAQTRAKAEMIKDLMNGNVLGAEKIREMHSLTNKDTYESPAFIKDIQNHITDFIQIDHFNSGNLTHLKPIKEKYLSVGIDIMDSGKIKEKAEQAMQKSIEGRIIDYAIAVRELVFGDAGEIYSKSEFKSCGKTAMLECLRQAEFNMVPAMEAIKKELFLPDALYKSQEFQELGKAKLLDCLAYGNREAMDLIRKLGFAADFNEKEFIKANYLNFLQNGEYQKIFMLKDNDKDCQAIFDNFISKQMETLNGNNVNLSEKLSSLEVLKGICPYVVNGSEEKLFQKILADLYEIVCRQRDEDEDKKKFGIAAFETLEEFDYVVPLRLIVDKFGLEGVAIVKENHSLVNNKFARLLNYLGQDEFWVENNFDLNLIKKLRSDDLKLLINLSRIIPDGSEDAGDDQYNNDDEGNDGKLPFWPELARVIEIIQDHFSIDELVRFPFLVSPLIEKK